MTKITVHPTLNLKGEVEASPSKSHTHRILTIGLLSDNSVKVYNPLLAGDVNATIDCCRLFGADIKITGKVLEINPPSSLTAPSQILDAKNSGTTIRFMMSIAAIVKGTTKLTGSPQLKKRPMADLVEALNSLGARCEYLEREGYPPLAITGSDKLGGETWISGGVSSQFISSLLLALPKSTSNSKIHIKPPVKSKPYIKMTLELIDKSGVEIKASRDLKDFIIMGNQHYKIREYYVPGDWSSIAFILAAGAITQSSLKIVNVDFHSISADRKIVDDLRKMGVKIEEDYERGILTVRGGELKGAKINCSNSPDLIPVLAVVASYAEGRTILYGAEHVRYKESNRIQTAREELIKMGVKVKENKTGLTIEGKRVLTGCDNLNAHGDHRIFMALCIAALKADTSCTINGLETYSDSYPNFIKDLKSIGVKLEENLDAG
ncbi:MAG: 3-phosphoshikimate 1-carboxyvinyltransferase [Candidatus Odinarchaeum yellowstonii]|uniref:3-phosphoshikimate 1-carboxyvinyltransferase n=1 Tax=Odinarchaeota yellowstonii (strain LCB_4) TaxID=1841599 RepID=A0AAF0D2H7_ODILC|nr:MAG: 3-phosphoshikimate 1-carboxyvinyltransferase [Candidatus Odinarchaeum yellowstonii]